MKTERLTSFLRTIRPADRRAMDAAEKRQAELAKPPGSLGRLEEYAIRMAGITGEVRCTPDRTKMLVFAADNGVVSEGVSCTPPSVTRSQSINMTRAMTGMSVLAKFFGCGLSVVDVGIDADKVCPAVVDRKIRKSTGNIAAGPAMTKQEALDALFVGIEQAQLAKNEGVQMVGVGEMGIGNTTTSAAVLAALTGAPAESVAGRGGGLTDAAFQHKKAVIAQALQVNAPCREDVLDVLSKVGGLDIAAMTGAFLGCAANRIAAVVDGYISVVAALCAYRLCPDVKDYLFLSHASYEVGYRLAAEELGLKPCLLLDMRLGEGSGCPLMFQILQAACAVQREMATFQEAEICDDYLDEIRGIDAFQVTI